MRDALWIALGLAVAALVGGLVVASLVADALMLHDAGGWLLVSVMLVTPAVVGLYVWRQR